MKNDQAEMEMEFADEPSASRHDATEVEAVREVDFPWEGIFREQLRFLLHYAVLAPSTHNTQPWKFDLTPEGRVEAIRMKAVSPTTDFSFDFHHLRLSPVAADAAPWD